jgi:hypothetical protein
MSATLSQGPGSGEPEALEADVYAGDLAPAQSPSATGTTLFVFRIEAYPEPDVFARIAILFNPANTAPQRVILRRESRALVNITVAIELAGADSADRIRRKLEQLTCTASVVLTAGEPDA